MNILIAGGSGFIGQALVPHLCKHHHVTVLGRDPQKNKRLFGDSVNIIDWQRLETDPDVLKRIDCIINLCGENIGAKRWTPARKAALINSRVKTTEAIAAALLQCKDHKPRLLNASALSAYGFQNASDSPYLPPPVDENSPSAEKSNALLPTISQAWEAATLPAVKHGNAVTLLRFGVVLARHGGALPKMVKPFQFFIGGRVGKGNQALSFITLNDLIRAIDFILANETLTGPVNLTAMKATSQEEFAHAIASQLRRPAVINLPAWLIKLVFGQMGQELLLEGQHAIPGKLCNAGFTFQQPDIETALAFLYPR